VVPFPIAQVRVILTPPEVAAAAASGVLIASAPAMANSRPSFRASVAPLVPSRPLLGTHLVIA
jgi:hypothetical protein